MEKRKATSGGGRGGKGLPRGEQPTGGRGSDTEPSYHVDPIGGCAPVRMRVQTVCRPTFDPREEPGALAAHAGICAGALSNERPYRDLRSSGLFRSEPVDHDAVARAVFNAPVHHSRSSIMVLAAPSSSVSPASTSPPWKCAQSVATGI